MLVDLTVPLIPSGPRYNMRMGGHSPGPVATVLSTTTQEQALLSPSFHREKTEFTEDKALAQAHSSSVARFGSTGYRVQGHYLLGPGLGAGERSQV